MSKTRELEHLQSDLKNQAINVMIFLQDHKYQLSSDLDTEDNIEGIPCPAAEPVAMISDFLKIVEALGPWLADHAALKTLEILETLKIKCYERHYMLLSVITTLFVKIRAMCESSFAKLSEKEKALKFSTSKVHGLLDYLEASGDYSHELLTLNFLLKLAECESVEQSLFCLVRNSKTKLKEMGDSISSSDESQVDAPCLQETEKSYHDHEKKIAEAFTDCRPRVGIPCYLYYIQQTGYGILTSKQLPEICPFSIWAADSGKEEIRLELTKETLMLSRENLERAVLFLKFILADILNLQKHSTIFDPEASKNSFVIAPVKVDGNERKVDWDLIERIIHKTHSSDDTPTIISARERGNFKFQSSRYHDAVVVPWYRAQDQFIVAQVSNGLSPLSAFPNYNYANFKDYYLRKYNINIQDLKQPLLKVNKFSSSKLNFLCPRVVSEETTSVRQKQAGNYLVAELCTVHPLPAHLWKKALALPSILYKINALLLAHEIKCKVVREMNLGSAGPSQSLILQALTASSSNDWSNLERLEILGDSFLKYATTVHLYCTESNLSEGKLTQLKDKQVCNNFLYQIGCQKKLGESMVTTIFDPHNKWLPPCMIPDQFKSPITHHSIHDKSIADCVEALIGAYLTACGQKTTLLFMSWLGFRVIPKRDIVLQQDQEPMRLPGTTSFSKSVDENGKTWWKQTRYCFWESAIIDDINAASSQTMGEVNSEHEAYERLEESIGYKFRNRFFLLHAFTHGSETPSKLENSYERLEFLGDAILDYLITKHLYDDARQHSPGVITDIRSSLVNNETFASLAVRCGLHKLLLHDSSVLNDAIDRFVESQTRNGHSINIKWRSVDDEEQCEDDLEAPKVLCDVFESLAGAIYIDSKMSLDAVWTVYYRIMKAEIEQFSEKIPLSPVRQLLELKPEAVKFDEPERLPDGRCKVVVTVFDSGTFEGVATNGRIAKIMAAKLALKRIEKSTAYCK